MDKIKEWILLTGTVVYILVGAFTYGAAYHGCLISHHYDQYNRDGFTEACTLGSGIIWPLYWMVRLGSEVK